ncbi:DUF2399 domain-containing protein [Streptomyces sp. DT2A-34]|uniref:DUF2399 domain-containing protein n=1 Tax=Streptomyces sp. DT2A-34 TaxID=3051182 RepID=UPI00265C7F8C|nr:DUF2399 domain-containing protein [Streptomyces sp. DT2A-34]MDO0917870.1 DUF2399 domain-containing protein [Streptomyces sp. DT2A-34]
MRDWLGEVHAWRDGLAHLSATDLPLPDATAPAADLNALQPADLTLAAVRAHAQAAPRLQRHAEEAARQVQAATETVTALTEKLHQAQQAAPVPAPPPWRTRTPGDGVPLWALVDFAPGLHSADADRLEGALLVAGLLDALVTPDGRVCGGDLTLTPTTPAPGRTLADLLVVEDTPAIDTTRVGEILAAIPLDAPGSDTAAGRLAHGVLTASAPAGYRAAFIGRTTRERARQQHVRRLEDDLAAARSTLKEAEDHLAGRRRDITAAAAERDSLPPVTQVDDARDHAADRRAAADALQHRTAVALADADRALERILAELEAAAAARTAAVDAAALTHEHARHSEARAAEAARIAEDAAAEQAAIAQASADARARAAAAQQAADTEQDAFPRQEIESVEAAHRAEDAAEQDLNRARADVVKATGRHEDAGKAVSEALRALNRAAALPAGDMLRTEPDYLDARRESVAQFVGHIQAWAPAAQRVADLLARADGDRQQAAERRTRHTQAQQEADRIRRRAEEEAATVAEMQALHGAQYQELLARRDATAEKLRQAEDRAEQCRSRQQEADRQASAAQATLVMVAPQREAAEKNRDACLAQLGRLVDEHLAQVPDDIPTEGPGRPANITAGLAWARRLLADAPGGTDRRTVLERQRDRDLTLLETAARKASTGLAGFDRQVTLLGIEDTPWRRAVVADPAAVRGEDVTTTVQDLKATAAQLEDDLRADIKQVLKTSLFTRLQRDIQLRREAALELVAQIHDTLKDVRTGVAHVGVQVEWDVRTDYGIIADRLSATVLLHQVRALGDGPIDRRLNEATTPVALNLLDLTRTPPRLAPQTLTVVENPSVLKAAMECASPQPMACTSGQLRAVDHVLLQLAVDQGVRLRYTGDLDAAGLHIAATVQQTYGAELIAMDTALVRAAGDLPSAVPLGPLPSICDPALAAQLRTTGRVLYQEHDAVLTRLLDPASSKQGGCCTARESVE